MTRLSRDAQRLGLKRLRRYVHDIRDRIGTPFFAYDWPSIDGAARHLLVSAEEGGIGSEARFFLAFFAMPNLHLISRLATLDPRIGVACNTPEEIVALRKAGWSQWERVVFSGGVLPKDDLEAIASTGCSVNVASVGNLHILLDAGTSCRLGVRLDFTNQALKGFKLDDAHRHIQPTHHVHSQISALHAYPGTEIDSVEVLLRHAGILVDAAAKHSEIDEINFGGGFGYDYRHRSGKLGQMLDLPAYFSAIREMVTSRLPGRQIKLGWEPGRIVFAGSGFFVTEVLETRQTSVTTADVYLDSSFVQIPAPKFRDRQHLVVALDSSGRRKRGACFDSRLCGATTLSSDTLLPGSCLLPAVEPGDLLAILDVGAYGRAGSYNFLGKAKPPEVCLEEDSWTVLRRRQPADHLLEGLTNGF